MKYAFLLLAAIVFMAGPADAQGLVGAPVSYCCRHYSDEFSIAADLQYEVNVMICRMATFIVALVSSFVAVKTVNASQKGAFAGSGIAKCPVNLVTGLCIAAPFATHIIGVFIVNAIGGY